MSGTGPNAARTDATDRRDFLRRGVAGTAALGLASAATTSSAGADDRITVGVIGCGGRGKGLLSTFARQEKVRLAYACDPDEARREKAAGEAERVGQDRPQAVADLRQVLDDRSVDAVVVATPDHWHGPATLLALEAGKHVYVEKPASHNVAEGRWMIEAARKHDRVVQVGTQSRSTEWIAEAMQKLREGIIGEVLVSKAWNSQKRSDIGHASPSAPPPGFDYHLWVGPAPMVPYQTNRHHYTWHWWYDFGTGDMGNDGVHELDIARWGLGVETHPTSMAGLGNKLFFGDDQQFPDTQSALFEYEADGQARKQLVFEMRIWAPYRQQGYENGNAFYGTEGYMLLGKGEGYQVFGPRDELREEGKGRFDSDRHCVDFLDAIRTGRRPNADIEIGHLSTSLCHLGNIASRVGPAGLRFDPVRERFSDAPEADALLGRTYRAGHWAAPASASG